ncbi:YveK family protein [Gorillibacterium sp. sgz500922]|uniref:YveK family protein n=1 Tax=Gorillibacterium sp. sgz500922 TaxID=3446694 RepID=UPI003F67396C
MEIKQFIALIRKRFLWIALMVLIAGVSSGLYSYFVAVPVYEASTKLIVNKSLGDDSLSRLTLDSVNVDLRLIDTYKEIIKTPAVMNAVARDNPELKLSAKELIQSVKVSSVNNTQVMTVSVRSESPEKAAQIVNAVAKGFQDQISSIMKVDNVAILNEADPADRPSPVAPNPTLSIAVSLVAALLFSLVLIFLIDYFDDSIRTEEDVARYLDIPALAVIPRIRGSELKRDAAAQAKDRMGETRYAAANR